MKKITSRSLADMLTGYLRHELSISELTDWAEQAMMEGEFADENYETIRDIVSRPALLM